MPIAFPTPVIHETVEITFTQSRLEEEIIHLPHHTHHVEPAYSTQQQIKESPLEGEIVFKFSAPKGLTSASTRGGILPAILGDAARMAADDTIFV
jgi:hypothetical protein